MINLAARDIAYGFGRYVFTALGLSLLIGVTLTMAGVFRGMVDDAQVLLSSTHANIWVVQQGTLGPYAEASVLHDDEYLSIAGLPGVDEVGNVTYLSMQVKSGNRDVRVMIAGFEPGRLGEPGYLVSGRPITRSHYEAVADVQTGFKLGEKIWIRRNEYTIVGLTRRMVSSGGDPMVFVTLNDAQQTQFLKDNDAIYNEGKRLAANPQLNRPGIPGLLEAVEANQQSNHNVNSVLVRVKPGYDLQSVADNIKRWEKLQAYTKEEMREILISKLVATASRQIGMFLVILTVVSAAIIALIIYTMTINKIKEIAVLKLIGTKNRTIVGMILQEALGLGIIGFIVGKVLATLWAPAFPKFVLLEAKDAGIAFAVTMIICVLSSILGIRAALRVDPASAIGG